MEKINKLYKEVFAPNGDVKCCGRYKCMDLIEACLLYYKNNYNEIIDFGNLKTGFMNIQNIQKFVFSDVAKIE